DGALRGRYSQRIGGPMSVGDRRRAFAWLDLEALDRIDQYAPAAAAAGVRNVYLALAQTAARRHDGEHDGLEATRQELASSARPDAVKEKEERGREGARAREPEIREEGGLSEPERQVVAELAALLAERGQQLSARDRLGLRSAVGAAPDGVDVVAAAQRLRRNYGTGGKAERRPIASIVRVLITEIERSSERPSAEPRAPRSTRPSSVTRARSVIPPSHNIHVARPALDPPGR